MVEGGQKQAAQCCCQKAREREGLMIRREIHTPALSASVSMEMIPRDHISFRLHIHEGLGPALSTLLTSHPISEHSEVVLLCHFTAIKTHPPKHTQNSNNKC